MTSLSSLLPINAGGVIPYICAVADEPPPKLEFTPFVPIIKHAKRKGEWAEIIFLGHIFALGFNACKPWGDCAPYDWMIEGFGRTWRIQVKVAFHISRNHYQFHTTRSTRYRAIYTQNEIDFFACLVAPLNLWYIIPIQSVMPRKRTLSVFPAAVIRRRGFNRGTRSYEQFRERWDLLR